MAIDRSKASAGPQATRTRHDHRSPRTTGGSGCPKSQRPGRRHHRGRDLGRRAQGDGPLRSAYWQPIARKHVASAPGPGPVQLAHGRAGDRFRTHSRGRSPTCLGPRSPSPEEGRRSTSGPSLALAALYGPVPGIHASDLGPGRPSLGLEPGAIRNGGQVGEWSAARRCVRSSCLKADLPTTREEPTDGQQPVPTLVGRVRAAARPHLSGQGPPWVGSSRRPPRARLPGSSLTPSRRTATSDRTPRPLSEKPTRSGGRPIESQRLRWRGATGPVEGPRPTRPRPSSSCGVLRPRLSPPRRRPKIWYSEVGRDRRVSDPRADQHRPDPDPARAQAVRCREKRREGDRVPVAPPGIVPAADIDGRDR